MGIFFSGDVNAKPVEDALTEAMLQPPIANEADARQQAEVPARRAARSAATGGGKFEAGRFIGAVIIFGVLLGLAVAADALDWVSDAKYLYGVFGARVMWAYVNDVAALDTRATGAEGERSAAIMSAFPDPRLVLLRRRDRVAQAVSWAKAEQTGRLVRGRCSQSAAPTDVRREPHR